MLSSKFKKFAQENGLKAAHGVAYGYYKDYLITLSESSEIKHADFSVFIDNEEAISSLLGALNDREFRREHLIDKAYVTDNQVNIVFLRAYGVMKKIPEALDAVVEKMNLFGVKGKGYCPYCGQALDANAEDMYLVNDLAMHMHSGCLETVKGSFAENAEIAKTTGSVLTGTVGAILGAIVGAIPWTIAYFLDWFVGFLGYLIGLASDKGYDLLHGKKTKIKGVIVLIVSLLAVVLAEYAVIFITFWQELHTEPGFSLGECFSLLNYAISIDSEFQAAIVKDLLLGWLFAVMGMYSTIKQIFIDAKHTSGEIIKL